MNNYGVALIVLEFVIAMLFYPLRIRVKGHASLAHDKLELDLTVFRLSVARLRVRKQNGAFTLLINGKTPKLKGSKGLSLSKAANAVRQYRLEGIKARGSLLALIGTEDARDTAMAYAIVIGVLKPIVDNLRIYTAQPSDTLEIDGRARLKINLVQIASLIAAAIRG